MPQLKYRNMIPPGGLYYVQAETGLKITADNLPALVKQVQAHRTYKLLEPTDPVLVQWDIEHQLCARLGTDHCAPESEDDPWVPLDQSKVNRLGLREVIDASKALLDWFVHGRDLVPMEEADRRRKICAACPLNMEPKGCNCSPFYKLVDRLIPQERRFGDVNVCGVCQCSLKALCSMPMDQILKAHDGKKFTWPGSYCWQAAAHEAQQPKG